MTIEIQIKSLLDEVCGQVHLKKAPSKTQAPYICYTPVSGVHDDCLAGQSYCELCFQVDVYAKTYKEASSLKNKAFLKLKQLGISKVSTRSDLEDDTELYRETLEFFII